MQARIYRPSPNAMQSGRAQSQRWLMEYVPESRPSADPLMGYTASSDMPQQVRLEFPSLETAVAYAERNGIPHQVAEASERVVKPQAYSDNFRVQRSQPWTH